MSTWALLRVDEFRGTSKHWVRSACVDLLARATRFDFPRYSPLSPLYVERTSVDDADTWAVRWDGRCYTTTGWVMEPQPSSRDASFLARARYPRDEALAIAEAGPPCPHDTDGDGDCGKVRCPYRGGTPRARTDRAGGRMAGTEGS